MPLFTTVRDMLNPQNDFFPIKQPMCDWSYRTCSSADQCPRHGAGRFSSCAAISILLTFIKTHRPLPPGLSDCFYALPIIWKTISPGKLRRPSSEGNVWKAIPWQGLGPSAVPGTWVPWNSSTASIFCKRL